MKSQIKRLESNEQGKTEILKKLALDGWCCHEVDYYQRTKVIEIFRPKNPKIKKYLHVKVHNGESWPIHVEHSQTLHDNFYYVLSNSDMDSFYIIPSLEASIIMEEDHRKYIKKCKEKDIPYNDGVHRELRNIRKDKILKYKDNWNILN